jgi:hypothetical protein
MCKGEKRGGRKEERRRIEKRCVKEGRDEGEKGERRRN